MFKRKRKDDSQIILEKETRKELVKYVLPIMIGIFIFLGFTLYVVGDISGFFRTNKLMIVVILAYFLLIPFLWFMEKPRATDRVLDKMMQRYSKSLVDRMMVPNVPVQVNLFKARDSIYGDCILKLKDKGVFYAVLGEKDNLISIYIVLHGDDEKINLEVISKCEFADYYQLGNEINSNK